MVFWKFSIGDLNCYTVIVNDNELWHVVGGFQWPLKGV